MDVLAAIDISESVGCQLTVRYILERTGVALMGIIWGEGWHWETVYVKVSLISRVVEISTVLQNLLFH
jgi:hypothetical protein